MAGNSPAGSGRGGGFSVPSGGGILDGSSSDHVSECTGGGGLPRPERPQSLLRQPSVVVCDINLAVLGPEAVSLAHSFGRTRPMGRSDRLGSLRICGGGGFTASAGVEDQPRTGNI